MIDPAGVFDSEVASHERQNWTPSYIRHDPFTVLCRVRSFEDLVVCGITSQLRLLVSDFDEITSPGDEDFEAASLRTQSLIRLGCVPTVPLAGIKGQVSRLVDDLSQAVKP